MIAISDWKTRFDTDWREVLARDEVGELHIADIKAPKGLVIEFLHSAIKPDEVVKRTKFYGQVIWIIDGTHHSTDLIQYERVLSENYAERCDGVVI